MNPSDNPKRSLKRALSVVSSPAKSQKLDTWYDDAQDPNWTPPIEPADTVCETPAPSEADAELPARTGGDMPPPPPPSGPDVKDALYWKFLSLCLVIKFPASHKPRPRPKMIKDSYFVGFKEYIKIQPLAVNLRLRRCCVVNGKKASADAVKLFKSRDGRA